MQNSIKKICIVSDAIQSPFDEGVKVFVYNLIKELSVNYDVLALTKAEENNEVIGQFCTEAIPGNKLFLGKKMFDQLHRFKPDLILYIPIACATVFSFLRARVMKMYYPMAKNVMITLQPRGYSSLFKKIISAVNTDLVLAQSDKTVQQLEEIGCTVKKVPVGVDLDKFKPVDGETKRTLRKAYGVPGNDHVVLHVGHINRDRNIQIMLELQAIDGIQTLIVGSTSTPREKYLMEELKTKGVIIIDWAIEAIEQMYQLSDCYLFPVFLESACIELPLSVFEAIACNLPLVTTKFGDLPELIQEGSSIFYGSNEKELVDKVCATMRIGHPNTIEVAQQYSWENFAKQIIDCCIQNDPGKDK